MQDKKGQNKLIIFGCGGHARAVLDVVLYNGDYTSIAFVDENAREGEKILNFPVVKEYDIRGGEAVFVAIGDNKKRITLGASLEKLHPKNLVSIVSKRAHIGESATIGKGVFVAHNTHIGIGSRVEDFALINTSSSIDHECSVGCGTFVAPSATLCGKVNLGINCFVGANATIIDNISVCDNVVIGAGATVIKNIEQAGTYIGTPAKRRSENK